MFPRMVLNGDSLTDRDQRLFQIKDPLMETGMRPSFHGNVYKKV